MPETNRLKNAILGRAGTHPPKPPVPDPEAAAVPATKRTGQGRPR